MTKFKVGDKAEFIERYCGYKIGDVVEIIDVVLGGDVVNAKGKLGIFPIYTDSLKLVEPKLTKNQRIKALEKEIAELRPLKEKIEHLEQAVQQYFAVPGESSTVGDKPKLKGITIELEKTPNQQRAEIIEKAKAFVKENVKIFIGYEFVISDNEVKLYSRKKYEEYKLHTAKCHPSDVFNEHIGKAIALGRALGLDVSEFENAVQPTQAVVGMIIRDYYDFKEAVTYKINKIIDLEYANGKLEHYRKGTLNHNNLNTRILNDTNAIYGGGEL